MTNEMMISYTQRVRESLYKIYGLAHRFFLGSLSFSGYMHYDWDMKRFAPLLLAVSILVAFPTGAMAATTAKLTYAAWIPYWAKTAGVADATSTLGKIQELSPFAYEVEEDGTIIDTMKLAAEPWKSLMTAAKAKKVSIIPSILWIDADAIHATLSDPTRRKAHVNDIVSMVVRNNFDGIDIDYEGKKAKTKAGFSAFIKELALALDAKKKTLVCTIEPRTPPSSLYRVLPEDIEYVNDYVVLNTYCDEVRVMTYDQTTADIKLNDTKGTRELYAPVADTEWVKKVMDLTAKTISKKKLMLGVATYGYIYEVDRTTASTTFKKVRAISDPDARALAIANGVNIGDWHNTAGERSFNYEKNGKLYYVSWSDSFAVAQKIALAKKLGIKGVAIFKIDGKVDPGTWSKLK